jgi:glycosyltransferase involved in cell wall biosynthesis
MRIAIVHDWFAAYAGSERVVEQMLAVYPQADVFALFDFLAPDQRAFLGGRTVHTSFLQHMPFAQAQYRLYLPLMPLAASTLDVRGYNVVISSSHAVSKGVRTTAGQLHLCMCYAPMRYAWDLRDQYLDVTGLNRGIRGTFVKTVLNMMRRWDLRSSRRIDAFIAISEHIRQRIRAAYGRESTVIYPAVDVDFFTPGGDEGEREDCYVTASRFVPYKRLDLIAAAFAALPNRRLVIIGDGPDVAKVTASAGPNVQLLGHQPKHVLRDYLRRARAFIFAAEEDFGIAPLEAQACGTPVIGYGAGALPETIASLDHPHPTGVLFGEQTVAAIVSAISAFETSASRISREACRQNALRFAPQRFREQFHQYVEQRITRAASERAPAPETPATPATTPRR